MKKQIKNNNRPIQPAPLLKYTYLLIASIIIALILSPAHIKTAYDPDYQELAHVSENDISEDTHQAATKKLFESIDLKNLAMAREAIAEYANTNASDSLGTPLIHAIRAARYAPNNKSLFKIIQLLLAHNANPNIQDTCGAALIWATHANHLKIVQLLLKHNANPNVQNNDGNETALIMTTLQINYPNSLKIAQSLLKHNANPHMQDKHGDTTLMCAATSCHHNSPMIELLLTANANLHMKNNYGNTALMLSACNNHIESIQALLKHNANPNIQNKDGNTALMLSASNGGLESKVEVMRMLILHGADTEIINNAGQTVLDLTEHLTIKQIIITTKAIKDLGEQNWDTEALSESHLVEIFISADPASVVYAYANPYYTTEPVLYKAMRRHIQNNKRSAKKEGPTSVICCAAAPDCNCSGSRKKEKTRNKCAIQ